MESKERFEPVDIRGQISDAIAAHGDWKRKLRLSIEGIGDPLDKKTVSSDCNCAFGKFLHSDMVSAETRASKPYEVITRLHREFHKLAGDIVDLVDQGKTDEVNDLLAGAYHEKSMKLVMALKKWDKELAPLYGRRFSDN